MQSKNGAAAQSPTRPGVRSAGEALWSSRYTVLAVLFAAASGTMLLIRFQTQEELQFQDEFHASQDPRLARFDAYCGLPEQYGSPLQPEGELERVFILLAPGDSSSRKSHWPGDLAPEPRWSCRPSALPRRWRLNKKVHFQAEGAGSSTWDDSFAPELLRSTFTGSDYYDCAPGQLTGLGFRQLAAVGRLLGEKYHEFFGGSLLVLPSTLSVHSGSAKKLAASAVAFLTTFLAAPKLIEVWGRGVEVPVNLEEPARGEEVESSLEPGADLLARWCHRLPWPCPKSRTAGCMSMEIAAAHVKGGEVAACTLAAAKAPPEWISAALREDLKKGGLTVLSMDGAHLTAVLLQLLGRQVCEEPSMARPSYAAHLVLERWRGPDGTGWRCSYNGQDITTMVLGCEASGPLGCEEVSFSKALGAR